jgi:hypothetical integral membrane protein (TIGR02206 family)
MPMALTAFSLFSASHLLVLFLTAAVPVLFGLLVRRNEAAREWASRSFVALLLLNKLAVIITAARAGQLSVENALPMHLCDWATVAVAVALLWRGQMAFELAYFWGLGGTLQAVLTPDLPEGFSNPGTWMFFISHSGVIAADLFLITAWRLAPKPGAVWRAMAWSQVYLVTVAAVDWLFVANYGYLCEKPSQPSVLDHLGPWPVYILSLEAAALVSYALYQAPFFVLRRLQGKV